MSKKGLGKFVLGAGIGAGLALLFAPKKGSDLRRDIKRKFDEFMKDVDKIEIEDIKESFTKKVDEIKKELEDLDKEKVEKIAKKDGYKFVEWQVEGKKYDENTLVTSDIILKAKWEKVSKEEPIKEPNKEDTNVSEEVITKTIKIKNPKIKAINLYSDGKIKVVEPYFYGNDSVINVKVEGKKSLVDKIDASNISLGVDMSKYKKETYRQYRYE